jgi:hypothetical protein
MTFANPFWLWGLAALSIPIAIHLLSRKEGKVISVGSLRHLKDANTQQFKSLRLNEILLLMLRCLLFGLVVLFMSGLQMTQNNKQKWVLLEERLKDDSKALSILDSLMKRGYELHYVTSQLAVEGKILASSSYWALVEQLGKIGITEVVIISSSRAEDFKGIRIEQPLSMKWISLPIPDQPYLIAASKTGKNDISIKRGIVEKDNTHFKTSHAIVSPNQTVYKSENDSISITSTDTIKIVIDSDPTFSFEKKIVSAYLKAIQATVSEYMIIEESPIHNDQKDSVNVLIWLSEEPLPITTANTVIYYKDNLLFPLFFQDSDSTWQLTRRINEDVALNENFGIQLSKIILTNKTQREIANNNDQRTFPEKMMWANAAGGNTLATQNTGFESLDKYLIILILLTLLIERLIAYKRNQ